MKAMILKEIHELRRDRRTAMLLIAVPVLLLIIYGYAANFSVEKTHILIAGPGAPQTEEVLRENKPAQEHFEISNVDPQIQKSEVEDLLRDRTYNAVIYADTMSDVENAPLTFYNHIYIDGSQLFAAQSAHQAWIQVIIENNRKQLTEAQVGITTTASTQALNLDEVSTILFNPDLKTSWVMIPGLIGLVLAFIGTLITSIGLVREREAGTLEQLAVMPLRPSEIIGGKILPYFVLALIDISIITVVAVSLFDVPFEGSVWRFAVVSVLFLLTVLGIGVFISSISQTTAQAIQVAMMTIMPQVLLSGFIFPLDAMPDYIRYISYILPLTWFNDAVQGIMLRDTSLGQQFNSVVILACMAFFIFGAATLRMRSILRNGGTAR
ncbi:MAG: ABC transporter permease [Corynebacterium sp.]|nr:ABC transporter permease [Corynebacterium sp.]